MIKLKIRGLKWKRLKVRGSVLHFCKKKKHSFFFSHFLSRWTPSRLLILYLSVSQCLGTRPHRRHRPPPTTSLPPNSKSWEIFRLSFFIMLILAWTSFHLSGTRFSGSISEMGLLCFFFGLGIWGSSSMSFWRYRSSNTPSSNMTQSPMTSSSSSSKTSSFWRGRKEWHLVERFMVMGVWERVWDFGFQILVEWVTKREMERWRLAAAMRPCTAALWDREIENEKAREAWREGK